MDIVNNYSGEVVGEEERENISINNHNGVNKRSHYITLPHPDNDLHLHDDRKRKKSSNE